MSESYSGAFAVAQNVVTTLAAIQTGSPPANLFVKVLMSEDLAAFERIANAIPGMVAGIVCPPPRRGNPVHNGELYEEAIDIKIALKLSVARAVNVDDTAAITEMHSVVGIVRNALSVDVTRGGICGAAKVDGRFINPTDLRGEPRIMANRKGHQFYCVVWPISCGRTVPIPA